MDIFRCRNHHQPGVAGLGADCVKTFFPGHVLHIEIDDNEVKLVFGIKNFQSLCKIRSLQNCGRTVQLLNQQTEPVTKQCMLIRD